MVTINGQNFKINMFSRKLKSFFKKLNKKIIPGGEKQYKAEAEEIRKISAEKLNLEESTKILLGTKALLAISENHGKERMLKYIISRSNNKLNKFEAEEVLEFITLKLIKTYENRKKT